MVPADAQLPTITKTPGHAHLASQSAPKISDPSSWLLQPFSRIKNPPPEGVVLSLPLKGDKVASCPLRRRGRCPHMFIKIAGAVASRPYALALLDTLHIYKSSLHQVQRYQHNIPGPKNDYPNRASFSNYETY